MTIASRKPQSFARLSITNCARPGVVMKIIWKNSSGLRPVGLNQAPISVEDAYRSTLKALTAALVT